MLQDVSLGDVRFKARALEVLTSYQPFWLRLAMETVVGKAVADKKGRHRVYPPHLIELRI